MPRKDPNTLPAVAGTVERLVPGPKGEAEGLVLTDPAGRSRLVRFPPHLARKVEALVRPGEFAPSVARPGRSRPRPSPPPTGVRSSTGGRKRTASHRGTSGRPRRAGRT